MPSSHSFTFILSLVFGVTGYIVLHVSMEIMTLREDVRRLLLHSTSSTSRSDSSGGYVGPPLLLSSSSSYSSSSLLPPLPFLLQSSIDSPYTAVAAAATRTTTTNSAASTTSTTTRNDDDAIIIPKTTAVRCTNSTESTQTLLSQPRKYFKSQFGEDKILMSYFDNLCHGTYLEMGALNGYDASNTHVFHFKRNWSGVLLEASPTNYETLQVNRPSNKDIKIHAAICNTANEEEEDSSSSSIHKNDGEGGSSSNSTFTSTTTKTNYLHWVPGKYTSTGGFWEFASETQRKKFFVKDGLEKSTLVPCTKLSTVFDQLSTTSSGSGSSGSGRSSSTTTSSSSILYFDFYTLDIEGAEYTALQTIDFTKVMFGMIVVEASKQNTIKDMSVRTLLESNGYKQFTPDHADGMLFESDWFVNVHWHEIYHDLIY